ncbi:hypothetical protein HF087_11525 [Escherichia coli]|nr:hypothetical protein HF087_11525 [Escherichia coli]
MQPPPGFGAGAFASGENQTGANNMRYFNVDQIYADLITGRTTRTLVYSSLVRARKSEQPDRVEMFEEAIQRFDEWRATPNFTPIAE